MVTINRECRGFGILVGPNTLVCPEKCVRGFVWLRIWHKGKTSYALISKRTRLQIRIRDGAIVRTSENYPVNYFHSDEYFCTIRVNGVGISSATLDVSARWETRILKEEFDTELVMDCLNWKRQH